MGVDTSCSFHHLKVTKSFTTLLVIIKCFIPTSLSVITASGIAKFCSSSNLSAIDITGKICSAAPFLNIGCLGTELCKEPTAFNGYLPT